MKTKLISFRLDPGLLAKLDKAAKAEKVSRGDLVCKVLDKHLTLAGMRDAINAAMQKPGRKHRKVSSRPARSIEKYAARIAMSDLGTAKPSPSEKPEPKNPKKAKACPRCGGGLVPWGVEWKRCSVCKQNFRNDEL
jgi:tRNA(Ile2) C34 agmatinyltransferase TiaS